MIVAQNVAPVLSGGVWDPRAAASAASAFATGLTVIVLIVTAERLVSGKEGKGALSVAMAPIALAMLLVAAYFFVLIAGSSTNDSDLVVELSALLFAFAGSLLAMSAVVLFFIVAHGVNEQLDPDRLVARQSVKATYYVVVVVTTLFLVFGYDDIRTAIDGADGSPWWWVWHAGAVLLPTVVLCSVGRRYPDWAERRLADAKPVNVRVMYAGAVYFVVLPVIAYLSLSNLTKVPQVESWALAATLGMAVWYGVGLGVMTASVMWQVQPTPGTPRSQPAAPLPARLVVRRPVLRRMSPTGPEVVARRRR